MKSTILAVGMLGLLWGGSASAQTGFYLPTSTTSSGQDEFRAADGTSCRSTMDGTKRVEVGTFTYGSQNPAYGYGYAYPSISGSRSLQGNIGVYGRISVSLDARPERMDCNKLFELELERRRLEVEVMKRSLQAADRDLDQQKRVATRPTPERPDAQQDRLAQESTRADRSRRGRGSSGNGLRMAPI